MAFIQLNYDPEQAKQAAMGGGRTLEPGWYIWQVQSFEHQGPKEPGKHPLTVMKCEIRQSFNQQALGKTITVRFSHAPSTIPYNLMPFLKAVGIPFQDNGSGSLSFDDSLLHGAIVKAVCRLSPRDNGGHFENWENFEPAGGGPTVAPAMQPAFAPPQQPQYAPAPQQPQQTWQPPQQPAQMQPPQTWPQTQQAPMQYPQQPQMQPQYAPQPYPQNGQNGAQPQGAPQGWPPGAYPQPTGR